LLAALLAGTVSDTTGRRKLMLLAYAWFSIAMGITSRACSGRALMVYEVFEALGRSG
jgi:MFS family permease